MNLPVADIKTRLDGPATDLCHSMENGDLEKALAAQTSFTETVAGGAIHELPEQILDPLNDEKIKRELKLF